MSLLIYSLHSPTIKNRDEPELLNEFHAELIVIGKDPQIKELVLQGHHRHLLIQ